MSGGADLARVEVPRPEGDEATVTMPLGDTETQSIVPTHEYARAAEKCDSSATAAARRVR